MEYLNWLIHYYCRLYEQLEIGSMEVILQQSTLGYSVENLIVGNELFRHYRAKDSGVFDAWNKALMNISGQCVLFLGLDDIPTKEYLSFLCKQNLAENRVVVSDHVVTDKIMFFESDAKIIYRKKYTFRNEVTGFEFNVPPPSVAFSADIFKDNKFNSKYKLIGDGIFYGNTPFFNVVPFYCIAVYMCAGGISNTRKGVRVRYIEFLRAVASRDYPINKFTILILIEHGLSFLASFVPFKLSFLKLIKKKTFR
jgi:hypothetical protein